MLHTVRSTNSTSCKTVSADTHVSRTREVEDIFSSYVYNNFSKNFCVFHDKNIIYSATHSCFNIKMFIPDLEMVET